MKKLILCALVLISSQSFSQESKPGFLKEIASRLSFGLRAGVNYSNFNNTSFSTDPLVGFHAGGTVNFRMSEHWTTVEDVLFSVEGAKSTSALFGSKDIKLSYISVPIVFRYKTNPGLFFEIGTVNNFKVKEEVAGFEDSDFAKKISFAAVGGLGFQSKSGLGISLRYNYGITKVTAVTNSTFNNNFKSSNAQASLFYTF